MNEIKCPKCGTMFQINESDYETIMKQIRDKEFEKELQVREQQHQLEKENLVKSTEMNLTKNYQEKLSKKEIELEKIRSELENKEQQYQLEKENLIKSTETSVTKNYQEQLSEKEIELEKARTELQNKEQQHQIEKENIAKTTEMQLSKTYQDALAKKELEIQKLQMELTTKEKDAKDQLEKTFQERLNQKTIEIKELEGKLKLKETESELAIKNAIIEKEKEISSLHNQLEHSTNEFLLKEKTLKESYEEKMKDKEEQISYYKDFKARQSTKMIGESLEMHCSNLFNKLRPLFKNAYFEKDNDVKTGSKGDFIFKDYDEDGTEIVSIMFEMKNEADTTSTKHKNEDFFKELDKDRKEKNCEYAVLVSLLEIDNDYYNEGIVDVSHKYEKMYVIRPQFFIPLITLIRGLASNSLQYKKELQNVQNQNIDISHFEENMNNFKESFGRNYRLASEKFGKAIAEIDKTIDHLQKTKEALLSSENNLRIANHKAEDLTIRKLTSNSATVAKMFEEIKN